MSNPTDTSSAPITESAAPVAAVPVNASDIPPAPDSSAESQAPLSTAALIEQTLKSFDQPADPAAPVEGEQPATESGDSPADASAPAAAVSATSSIADDVLFADPRVVARMEESRPAVETYQTFQAFMQNNGITGDQLDQSLNLAALFSRGDYGAFLQHVQPYLQTALQNTGRILPDDLQAQVDAGTLSPEVARAKSETRIEQLKFEALEKKTREAQLARHEHSIIQAGQDFWRRVQDANPAVFAQRQNLYASEIYRMQATNPPRDAAAATEMCRQALTAVDAAFGPASPAKPSAVKPTMPRPPVGTPAPPPASVKLGQLSTMEAIQFALSSAAQ